MPSALWLLLAPAVHALAVPSPRSAYAGTSVHWSECGEDVVAVATARNITSEFECGELTVPLDYIDNKANKTHTIELIRIAANTDGQTKGSIIFNFGGPGDAGITSMVTASDYYLNITGGDYDLVSFSPRGTSKKYLQASCYEDPHERAAALKSNPFLDLVGDSTRADAGWGHVFALATATNSKCKKALEGKGEYMGTAYTARDVMAIVDALEEDKLNYWGISYGTILGATLVGMFPDRMGRVVLDSVVNPTYYYEAYGGPTDFEDLDATFRKLFEACVKAGPDGCLLADAGETADELEEAFQTLMKELAERPMTWPEELVDSKLLVAGEYLDDSALRVMILPVLYSPQAYSIITSAIAGLLKGDLTFAALLRQMTDAPSESISEALASIHCSDKRTPRDTSIEGAKAWAYEYRDSILVDKMSLHVANVACNSWPFSAKEKYMESFDLDTTASPVLLMGNTYDPVTPISSARNMTDGFKGSAMVEVKGFGHGAFNFPAAESACAREIAYKYFNEGALPEDGTVCESGMALSDILTATLPAILQAQGASA